MNKYTIHSIFICMSAIFLLHSTTIHTSKKSSEQKKNLSTQNTQKQPPQKTLPATARTITVTNNISSDMLTYKHWSGTYHPSDFKIVVNGTRINPRQKATIKIPSDNSLTVQYSYEFLNGARTGSKKVFFKMDADATSANISFSWHNKFHVIIDTAKPEKIIKIKHNKRS